MTRIDESVVSGEAEIRAELDELPDPELPHVTLGDLGVIRDVRIEGSRVEARVTPTYTACPATELIVDQVRDVLVRHGAEPAIVELQLDPAWSTDDITERGRARLATASIAPPPVVGETDIVALLDLPVACPRCASIRTRRRSDFGATACKAMYTCIACGEPFESFKPI